MLTLLALSFVAAGFAQAKLKSFTHVDKLNYLSSYVTIDTVFFNRNLGVSTQEIDQYQITICDQQPNSGVIQLLALVPGNPAMNMSSNAFVMIELGTSSTSFTSATVFATNYVYGISASSTIQVPYDVTNFQGRTFYIRVTAKTFATTYGLQVRLLASGTTINGQYDTRAFPTQNALGPFNYLDQYGTTGSVPLVVRNLDGLYLFVHFCSSDILNPNSAYQVTIQLEADTTKPRSAFNVYACPASTFVQSSCTNFFYAVADEETAPVASVTLTNSASMTLNQGIWILVSGQGGELDSRNSFYLSAKING